MFHSSKLGPAKLWHRENRLIFPFLLPFFGPQNSRLMWDSIQFIYHGRIFKTLPGLGVGCEFGGVYCGFRTFWFIVVIEGGLVWKEEMKYGEEGGKKNKKEGEGEILNLEEGEIKRLLGNRMHIERERER